ncbi:maintenance of ploidy protein mob2 [Podospora australis]|uniref:Maintenance of ploidy protein mob2 n=1 Tax=Podospora australis TaxID=1536484 RepID=A0AAN7APE9_9PEZI|nr:maintenance of ploidy protein mob2 [Podospora australis]
MSNLFSGINARLRGGSSKPGPSKSPMSPASDNGRLNSPDGLSQRSTSSANLSSKIPPMPASPSLTQSVVMATSGDDDLGAYQLPKPLPLWLNPAYAKHIVKGNFMTLSRRPKTVEQGEWVAHQVVEHYRNLWNFVSVIYQKEENGQSICNPTTCPRMAAGANHSYTWLNNRFEPIELPAFEYITLMQRWISGKIDDEKIFPTEANGVSFAHNSQITPTALVNDGPDEWIGKRSGFPKEFPSICKTIFLQMFRVYAHLYWAHFVEPFYHLNLEKQLNSCFSHYVLTALELDMLKPSELEPMQPLLDMWAANGTFPADSKAYACSNPNIGHKLLQAANMSQ